MGQRGSSKIQDSASCCGDMQSDPVRSKGNWGCGVPEARWEMGARLAVRGHGPEEQEGELDARGKG